MSDGPNVLLHLREFLLFIHEKCGYDFTNYSSPSLERRLRFALERFNLDSLESLQNLLIYEAKRIFEVLQFLTINTTEMFRNPEYFFEFRNEIVPILKTYYHPRLWVAGCSTGEEVLSYAIILSETGLLDRVSVYATDINPTNLMHAKGRIYRIENVKQSSAAYHASGGTLSLSEYYGVHGGAVIFDRALFENITFSDHCLATDSSFSEFQFVSCRHVLMYFNADLQARALKLFDESLVELGFLELGEVESIRSLGTSSSFVPWRGKRVYRKVADHRRSEWD